MKIEFKNGFEAMMNRCIESLKHNAKTSIEYEIDDRLALIKQDLMLKCATEIDSLAVSVFRRKGLDGEIIISLSFDDAEGKK